MAETRVKHQWAHTSSLMALIANAHRDVKKGRPFKPADFDPTDRLDVSCKAPPPKVGIEVLKQVFIEGRR